MPDELLFRNVELRPAVRVWVLLILDLFDLGNHFEIEGFD